MLKQIRTVYSYCNCLRRRSHVIALVATWVIGTSYAGPSLYPATNEDSDMAAGRPSTIEDRRSFYTDCATGIENVVGTHTLI